MFDDYPKKDIGKRIEITYRQTADIPVFPWEIGNFVNKMNTCYYKYEILNSISNALISGIDPRNILMMDKSLPLNNIYENFDVLDLQMTGLSNLYFIGRPISLIPNKKTYQLSLLLSLFEGINSFLYGHHIKPVDTYNLKKLWESSFENKFITVINTINTATIKKIEKTTNARAFTSLIDKYYSLNDELENDFEIINKALPDFLKRKTIENIEDMIPKKILDKYFLYFFRQFDKLTRPLFGISYYEIGKLRILGRALVNKNLVNYSTFELKEARRNSPLSDVFSGGAAIYSTIKNEERAKERHALELEILSYQRDKAKADAETARLDTLKKRLEVITQFEELARTSDVLDYQKINPGYLSSQVNHAYSQVTQKREELLKISGMQLDHDSIRIVDIKV